MEEAPFILIAEDEMALGELLVFNLEKEGFQTALVGDGRLALLRLTKEPMPHLMLLDWMLPGPSGLDICKRVRTQSAFAKMPILMLTARSDERDIIAGLEAGADDYLTKPFSTKVLVARIAALLRRGDRGGGSGDSLTTETNKLTFNDLTIEADNYRVRWQGEIIPLSPTGFRLLFYLARRANKIITRDTLLDEVWGQDSEIDLRTVDANIKRVRTLLKKTTDREFIKTAHGFGYFFES